MSTPSKAMVAGFLRCAAWTATAEDGEQLLDENALRYCPEDFTRKARIAAQETCRLFLDAVEGEVLLLPEATHSSGEGLDSEQGGHDLWLTLQRYGAGFWDGDWSHGEALTDAAHALKAPLNECSQVVLTRRGKLEFT